MIIEEAIDREGVAATDKGYIVLIGINADELEFDCQYIVALRGAESVEAHFTLLSEEQVTHFQKFFNSEALNSIQEFIAENCAQDLGVPIALPRVARQGADQHECDVADVDALTVLDVDERHSIEVDGLEAADSDGHKEHSVRELVPLLQSIDRVVEGAHLQQQVSEDSEGGFGAVELDAEHTVELAEQSVGTAALIVDVVQVQ